MSVTEESGVELATLLSTESKIFKIQKIFIKFMKRKLLSHQPSRALEKNIGSRNGSGGPVAKSGSRTLGTVMPASVESAGHLRGVKGFFSDGSEFYVPVSDHP